MTRWYWALLLLLLLTAIAGCAGSAGNLTGGSVPIGDVDGRLYVSSRTVQPVADTPVELVGGNGAVAQSSRTDNTGYFIFHQVPQGRYTVRATSGVHSGHVDFDLAQGDAGMNLSLLLDDSLVGQIVAVLIDPPALDHALNIGDTVTFSATGIRAQQSNQFVPNLPVSWLVRGRIGTITPDGVFTATQLGTGRVIAQYDDSITWLNVTVSGG